MDRRWLLVCYNEILIYPKYLGGNNLVTGRFSPRPSCGEGEVPKSFLNPSPLMVDPPVLFQVLVPLRARTMQMQKPRAVSHQ